MKLSLMVEGETKIALLRRDLCTLSSSNSPPKNQQQGSLSLGLPYIVDW